MAGQAATQTIADTADEGGRATSGFERVFARPSRRGRRRALVLVGLMLLVGVLAVAAPADAGTYTVHACDPAVGNANNSVAQVQGFATSSYTNCVADGEGRPQGIKTHASQNGNTAPFLSSALATFNAPSGTTIQSVDVNASWGHHGGMGWVSGIQGSLDRFTGGSWWMDGCTDARPACGRNPAWSHYEIPGATGVRLVTGCVNAGGCYAPWAGTYPHSVAYAWAHTLKVNINDPDPPAISGMRGEAWNDQEWHRGVKSVGFNASDATGISRMRVEYVRDGQFTPGSPIDQGRPCDYTYAVPCGQHALDSTIDTRDLPDGSHHLRYAAADAAGNWAWRDQWLSVDNTAPTRPIGVTVAGGEGWHTTNSFDVSWTNPAGQHSGIAKAHYRLYDAAGNLVAADGRSGTAIRSITGFTVPGPGDYRLKIFLEDAAGNVNDATASDPVHLKFDDVAPAQATPQHRNGWVNRNEASSYVQRIEAPRAELVPVSGIGGYAITTDGSDPGSTVHVNADSRDYSAEVRLGDLPEGILPFKARAISGAGVASAQVGSQDLFVDLTPPQVDLAQRVEEDAWNRSPVVVDIAATEPAERSGMAGAEASDPEDTNGAFVRYSVDNGPAQRRRGPERPLPPNGRREFVPAAVTPVVVDSDGRHTVTYSATDVAGNESPEQTVSFKIDRTPPELVVFEAQEQDQPRLVTVAASDATSGLADGGVIQLRRIRPTRGDWITLRTTRDGQRYSALIDNTQLPAGDYEFRAIVPDQAGNEATGTRTRSGEPHVLYIDPTHVGPYRTDRGGVGDANAADAGATVDTRVSAGVVQRARKATTKKCRTVRVRGKKRRKCTKRRGGASEQLVPRALVPFGRKVAARGTLTTASGDPLANQEITVLAKLDTEGAQFRAEGSARTDAAGEFRYTVPAAASRTLAFFYRGDSTYKRAEDSVTLQVPASATIRAGRRAVRNGDSVMFRGKLLGLPYPAKGKVLDLQAFYRGKWRTFATPRARQNGKWRFRYRFEATRGTVTYRFRVRIRASSDYSYERGFSRTVKVRVTG